MNKLCSCDLYTLIPSPPSLNIYYLSSSSKTHPSLLPLPRPNQRPPMTVIAHLKNIPHYPGNPRNITPVKFRPTGTQFLNQYKKPSAAEHPANPIANVIFFLPTSPIIHSPLVYFFSAYLFQVYGSDKRGAGYSQWKSQSLGIKTKRRKRKRTDADFNTTKTSVSDCGNSQNGVVLRSAIHFISTKRKRRNFPSNFPSYFLWGPLKL